MRGAGAAGYSHRLNISLAIMTYLPMVQLPTLLWRSVSSRTTLRGGSLRLPKTAIDTSPSPATAYHRWLLPRTKRMVLLTDGRLLLADSYSLLTAGLTVLPCSK